LYHWQIVAGGQAWRAKRVAVGCEAQVEGAVDVKVGYFGIDLGKGGTDARDVVAAADKGGADVGEEYDLVVSATGRTVSFVLADLLYEEWNLHTAMVVCWYLGEARALVLLPDTGDGIPVADDLLDAVMRDGRVVEVGAGMMRKRSVDADAVAHGAAGGEASVKGVVVGGGEAEA
jgi:hypothetical protein